MASIVCYPLHHLLESLLVLHPIEAVEELLPMIGARPRNFLLASRHSIAPLDAYLIEGEINGRLGLEGIEKFSVRPLLALPPLPLARLPLRHRDAQHQALELPLVSRDLSE